MRFALSKDLKTLSNIQIYPSIQNYQKALDFITEKKEVITNGNSIESISGGIAGVIQKNNLFHAPHLSEWNNKPISKDLKSIFKAKEIILTNDAALAGLGEAAFGSGSKYNIVSYITISTGVGGVRIVNKHIDNNNLGFEPGHQIINLSGEYKTFEQLTSGSWIEKRKGKKASEIKDERFWNEIEMKIAVGLNNVILMWSPDVVVLGGGIVNAGLVNLSNIENYLSKLIKIFPTIPPIVKSKLGDEVGLYGAMLQLNDKLL